jgi:hypothetical protein
VKDDEGCIPRRYHCQRFGVCAPICLQGRVSSLTDLTLPIVLVILFCVYAEKIRGRECSGTMDRLSCFGYRCRL